MMLHASAEFACLPPIDKIFTRIGTSDNIQSNSSTFHLEMKEMAHIVSNATQNSLVVIDVRFGGSMRESDDRV